MDEDEEINKAHHESSKTKTEQISTEASTNWIESSDSLNYFIRSSNDHHNESNILNEFGWNFNPESNHNHLITTNINNSSSSSDQMDLDRRLEYLTASNYSSRSPPDDQILPSVPARSTDFKVSNPSVSSSSSEEVLPEKSIESADRELPDKPATKGRKKGAKRIRQQRFAFMTKSDIDHLEDGYRWRKYGQKAVKNSPYPRSYYRCTNSNCTVKKRVERSSEDPTIVITTYEGQHCHHISSGFLRNTGGIHHLFSSHDLNRCSSTSGPTQIISSNKTSASSNDPYNIPRNMMQFPLSDDQLLGQNELLRPASLSSSSPSQVSMENVGLDNLPRSTTDEGLLGDIVSAEMRR